ncbi:MAG: hypothetical protein ACYC10_16685 [Allorhizobium sp.]
MKSKSAPICEEFARGRSSAPADVRVLPSLLLLDLTLGCRVH